MLYYKENTTRKLFTLFLVTILIAALCLPIGASAPTTSRTFLSSLSDEDCIEFVKSNGLSIPNELLDYQSLGAFIKNVITEVENDPDYHFVINYPVTYQFANQIKALINEHYGITGTYTYSTYATTAPYTLQYSTTVGSWLDEYMGYNCYGYAVGQTRPYDGFYLPYYPGCFNPSTSSDFSLDMTIEEMAALTESDLEYFGNNCIVTSTNYSDVIGLYNTHSIICLRKCSTVGKEDFHYMKYTGGYWNHKPGNTHVLKFNYLPHTRDWSNECSFQGTAHEGDRYYTGTIHFFAYKVDHDITRTYTGEHSHVGAFHNYKFKEVCNACGAVAYTWTKVKCSGPPCALQYNSIPGDREIATK